MSHELLGTPDEILEFNLPMESVRDVVTFGGLKDRLAAFIQKQMIDRIKAGITLPTKAVFLAACSAAFDKYVVAFDIPNVPEFIEQFIDAAAKQLFMQLMERLYDRLAARV